MLMTSVQRLEVNFWGRGRQKGSMSGWWKKFGPDSVKHRRKCPGGGRAVWKQKSLADVSRHAFAGCEEPFTWFCWLSSHTWQLRCKSQANGQWDQLQPGSWQGWHCWKSRGGKGKFPHGPCWASKHVLSFNPHNRPAREVLWSSFFPGGNEIQRINGLVKVTTGRAELGFTSKVAWLLTLYSLHWSIYWVLIAFQALCKAFFHSSSCSVLKIVQQDRDGHDFPCFIAELQELREVKLLGRSPPASEWQSQHQKQEVINQYHYQLLEHSIKL